MTHSIRDRAPAGGCMVLGTFYEGGEFLPQSMDGVGGAQRAPSQRQVDAAAARAERLAADIANSRHVGVVGARISVAVTVAVVLVFEGFYGNVYLTIARDAAGNVFVSKGSRWANEGFAGNIVASVKAHDMRDGVQQTVIQRVKVK